MSAARNRTASRRSAAQKLDISYLLNTDDDVPTRRPNPGSSSSTVPMPSTSAHRYQCTLCTAKFDHRSKLAEHMTKVHKVRVQHKCPECSNTFGEKGNLNRHIKSVHRGEKPYKCDQCPMAFPFRDTLQRHVKAVHEHQRPYPCTVCDMRFKKRDHLIRHMSSQHGGPRH